MAMMYSLSAYPADPQDKSKGKKIYARSQYDQIVTLDVLAGHIQEHGSPFTHDVITGVISAMVDCLYEQLVAGNRVDLGNFGTLQAAIRSEGVASPEDFRPATHVKSIEVNWTPSKKFRDLKNAPGIEYQFALTRREMAAAKKQAKADLLEEVENAGTGDTDTGGTPNPGPLE